MGEQLPAGVARFLCYKGLRGINLAVWYDPDTNKAWVGEQLPAGVARFFDAYFFAIG